jgi:hypothetical protein
MCFPNIDGQKIGAVFVIVINLFDVANLAAERRSSEAPEHENQWPALEMFAQWEARLPVECHKLNFGNSVAYLQISAVHVGQRVPHHLDRIFRTARHQTQTHQNKHNHG